VIEADEYAKVIAAAIALHQTRGLIDDATGLRDVVIHGRVNLVAVATELLAAAEKKQPPARSWQAWFAKKVTERRSRSRRDGLRLDLIGQLECHLASLRLPPMGKPDD
jgi:hypothetical protein